MSFSDVLLAAVLEFIKLIGAAIVIAVVVIGVTLVHHGHPITGYFTVLIIGHGFIGLVKLFCMKSGLDDKLNELYAPLDRWIERNFRWLPGAS